MTKTQAYDVINDLISLHLLKKTLIEVEPPIPSATGRRPRVYTWAHIEVKDAMDPQVQEATRRYWDTFRRYDPEFQRKESTDSLLKAIGQSTVDYYRGRGRTGRHQRPEVLEVKRYLNTAREIDH